MMSVLSKMNAISEKVASMPTFNRSMVANELVIIARLISERRITAAEMEGICPSCAEKMRAHGIASVPESVVASSRKADKWKTMPEGWTRKSRREYWESLTGDAEHKVTLCIDKMTGHIDDPGAFCAALADRVEGKEWRSER